MANPYIYNVVTVDGAALMAQATAANPIVWVGALSKATAAASAEDLAVKGKAWYDGKAGEIAAVSATDNVARPVAVWRPSGARQAALSLCVTARLASQTDADAVVMSAMSDPDSTIVLPGADDTGQSVGIPFPITIDAADTVAVTPGASASLADLERFVSAYKAGDPTQGEAQSIRGEKSFLAPVTKCRSIEPSAYGASSEHCGSADAPFATAYISTLKVDGIENRENPNYGITVHSSLVPSANGKYLGTTAHPFDTVSCYNLHISDNSGENTGTIYLYYDVTEGRCFFWTTAGITPEDVGMWLGHPDYPWDTVWAENFRGCIPYYASGGTLTEPAVGAIVLIFFTLGSLATGTLVPGQQIHSQGPDDLYFTGVYAAQIEDGLVAKYASSPRFDGTYSLLSAAVPYARTCAALAIRIA